MVSFTFTTTEQLWWLSIWKRVEGLNLTINAVWIHKDGKLNNVTVILGLITRTVEFITREVFLCLLYNGHSTFRKLCSLLDVTIKDELGQIDI